MEQSFLVSSTTKPAAKADQTPWCGFFDSHTKDEEHLQEIFYVRVLLIGSLLVAAATVSGLSYTTLKNNEHTKFLTQYNSIAESALDSVDDSFSKTNVGMRELASTYSYNFPNSSSWPDVAWLGFQRTAGLLGNISSLTNMAFSPIVFPSERASYEAYMKSYYLSDPLVTIPALYPGMQLGQVWALDWKTGIPYHDTTGYSKYSNRTYLAPVGQLTYTPLFGAQYQSFNLHSLPFFSTMLDHVMDCTESDVVDRVNQCGGMGESTPVPFKTYFDPKPIVRDIQAMMAHPVFPANNQTAISGFILGAISWKAMLLQAMPTFVRNIHCVITSGAGRSFTYRIDNGFPILLGEGDLHETIDKYRRSRIVNTQSTATRSTSYEMAFYPCHEFIDEYTSTLPVMAATGLVLVFVFCSIIFFAYDILMKREFGRKQAVLDTKRRFVRFISHEIRTPLNTVRLGLKLFDGEMSNVSAQIKLTPLEELPAFFLGVIDSWRHLADDISTNSASAVEVLDDLLNYDKIEMGNLRLELTMFNIWDLTRRTTSIMQMQAQQKNICLELSIDGLLCSGLDNATPLDQNNCGVHSTCVIGDVSRMGQVLRNLISNALKFTPAGGYVSVTAVTVQNGMPEAHLPPQKTAYAALDPELEKRAGSIRISVKDSGAGLTETQMMEICHEGVQFNANELQAGQGSGLGLFISKGIVEQHGGALSVSSEGLGKGVTFTVEIPLYQVSENVQDISAVLPTRKVASKEPSTSLGGSNLHSNESSRTSSGIRRTIVVDDSLFNRKMLVRLLLSRGYVCEQAENGEEAIRVYQALVLKCEPVHAILMDFEMPVMNGPTATKKLRELGCSCLIVGVTGNVLPEDVQYFKAQGADDVLVKPLVIEAFEELLHKRMQGRDRLGQSGAVSEDDTQPVGSMSTKVKKERVVVTPTCSVGSRSPVVIGDMFRPKSAQVVPVAPEVTNVDSSIADES